MKLLHSIAALALSFTLATYLSCTAQESVKSITIHAKKYAFEPAEITLTKGETVKLILVSDDVAHGLEVKGLIPKTEMPKDHATEITVTPAATGDFKGVCSKLCGMGHGKMKLLVHVVQP